MTHTKNASLTILAFVFAGPSFADSHTAQIPMMATGLILPEMNSEEGRRLFAEKACVVCHSINGVGGTDAPMLDAEFMGTPNEPLRVRRPHVARSRSDG